MKIAHFEAASGIAGDMTVASLLDAGATRGLSLARLREALLAVPLGHYRIAASEVEVGGIRALHFDVEIEHAAHSHHRHWPDIREMLETGRQRGLPEGAFSRAVAIFEVLARAEAKVHGVSIDDVHFHEVGAVDSIVDIVGAAWCLDQLGIDACTVATIPTGSGFVDTEHGRLAIPAPATAALLAGFDVKAGDGEGELVTPTGAAILAAMAKPMRPIMTLEQVGCGAGTMRLRDRPNVLRVFIGNADEASDANVVVIEADIDDMTPAALAHACERLRADGARDVSVLPLQMKKNRLGMRVSVLADYGLLEKLSASLMLHTSSIGVRYRAAGRSVLARRIDVVETEFGKIRVKTVVRPDGSESAEPEFEDVARAAIAAAKPFADVRAAALKS
ncbi:MAG TPA: nickel pincer cofactor biosynthesis protein LarC [Candidatus Limnocylindrales bacterium]|nr:nickel pincer cofactor biosynthesis protein LarC [Candidatus Limnocylindrales bacterium]